MNLRETSRSSCGSHDFGRAGRTARFGLLILLMAQPAFADSYADCSIEGACCFPRSSSFGSPRTVAMPDPRLATITAITVAEGSLLRPAVKRVLGNRAAVLGACTGGKGEVDAHLVVAPSGAVQVSRIVAKPQIGQTGVARRGRGAAMVEPSLTACATDAFRATTFPVTTGVTELDVRVVW